MARAGKTPFLLVVVLLLVIAVVSYYVYNYYEYYRNVDCLGVTCSEGEFCQDNTCKPISPPYTNNYYN